MPILFVGSTGAVGSEATLKLANRGEKIVALVRGGHTHQKASLLLKAGVGVLEGDLSRPETLRKAVRGMGNVVCTASSMPSAANDGLRTVDHDGILALIEAAESERVKKFVYVSYSRNICEDCPLQTAKRDCERRLIESNMQVIILRPSYFMEMWLSPALGFDPINGSARVFGTGEEKVSYISSTNVADFILAAATRTHERKNTILELGGPEPLSQLEVIRMFEEQLHSHLKVDRIPVEYLAAQQRSPDALQKTFGALMLAYAKGDVVEGTADLARSYGITLRKVADYATTFCQHAAAGNVR